MSSAPKRAPSLIERAATVYDFGQHLRPVEMAPVETPAAAPEPTPFVPSEVEGRATNAAHGVSTSLDTNGLSGIAGPVQIPAAVAEIDRIRLAQNGMLVPGAPVGALAEEFRLVKRQLLLTARELAEEDAKARARTILVGSGKPGDGKTYCTINLALSLAAERDTNVLLIDADFAKPDVFRQLGIAQDEDATGFLEILADESIDPETCVIATDVPHLSLLPAGKRTHHDTELLASARTADVIDRLLAADPRRIIVFDTPPALAASPASVLALLVGQVMLVVRADRTSESDVRDAVSLLDGCAQIGLVLNAVSYEPGGNRFGSYYGQER